MKPSSTDGGERVLVSASCRHSQVVNSMWRARRVVHKVAACGHYQATPLILRDTGRCNRPM